MPIHTKLIREYFQVKLDFCCDLLTVFVPEVVASISSESVFWMWILESGLYWLLWWFRSFNYVICMVNVMPPFTTSGLLKVSLLIYCESCSIFRDFRGLVYLPLFFHWFVIDIMAHTLCPYLLMEGISTNFSLPFLVSFPVLNFWSPFPPCVNFWYLAAIQIKFPCGKISYYFFGSVWF